MKYLVLILATFLVACGDDGGDDIVYDYRQTCDAAATFVGGWEDASLNFLDFGADCFAATTDDCDLRFTYYKPVNGKMMIDVDTTNGGPTCPATGETLCDFVHGVDDIGDEYLQVNCGQGTTFYFPQ